MTPRNVPSLAELQALMQRAVLDGDASAMLPLIPGNGRTTNDVLVAVYQHAYAARLVGVVKSDHPLVAALVGDEAFDRLARAYIAAHPSTTRNARWFAHKLPDFLAAAPAYSGAPALSELALIERALNDAFDAADAPVLSLADLGTVPPEGWGDLVLKPHPSATRLDLASNAHALWLALRDEHAPPDPAPLAEPQHLLAWRQGTTAMLRPLTAEEAMAWDEAAQGTPFGRLCELVAFAGEPDTAPLRAAGYLQGWLSSGALSSAMVAEEIRPAPHPASVDVA